MAFNEYSSPAYGAYGPNDDDDSDSSDSSDFGIFERAAAASAFSEQAHLPITDDAMPSSVLDALSPNDAEIDEPRPIQRVLAAAAPAAETAPKKSGAQDGNSSSSSQQPQQPPPAVPVVDGAPPAPMRDVLGIGNQDDNESPQVMRILGFEMADSQKDTAAAAAKEEAAAVETQLRLIDEAIRSGETDWTVLERARPPAEFIESLYRAVFSRTVRSVRTQFRDSTAAALFAASDAEDRDEADAAALQKSAVYDAAFVLPAMLLLAHASREFNYGDRMPVPRVMLKAYFDEFVARLLNKQPQQQPQEEGGNGDDEGQDEDRADYASEAAQQASVFELRNVLADHAAWPLYRTWFEAAVQADERVGSNAAVAEAVGRMVGVDLTPAGAGITDDAVHAAAKARHVFRLSEYAAAVRALAERAVFAARARAVADTRAYGDAVAASLRNASQGSLDVSQTLLTLPLDDRARRIGDAAQTLPPEQRRFIGMVVAAVNGYASPPADGPTFALSAEFSADDERFERAAAADATPQLERSMRQFTAGDELAASFRGLQRANDASNLSALRQGLRLRLRGLKLGADRMVPLIVNRQQRDASGVHFDATIVGTPRNAPVTLVWYFRGFLPGTPVRELKRQTLRPSGGDGSGPRRAKLIVVEHAPACGNGGVRYTALQAGQYWVEASAGNGNGEDAAAKAVSVRAELRVWAKCLRDGALYEVAAPRVHGECSWLTGPATRKRKLDKAAYLQGRDDTANDDAGDKRPQGPVDLFDDRAVLNVVTTRSPEFIRTQLYGYLATLKRLSQHLLPAASSVGDGDGDDAAQRNVPLIDELRAALLRGEDAMLAFVRFVATRPTGPGIDLDDYWRAVLRAGVVKTLRARTTRDVPVLSVLAALQTQLARRAMTDGEAAFLLDTLPQRLSLTFASAVWSLAMHRGQLAAGTRPQDLLLTRIALMTRDEVLSSEAWQQSLSGVSDGSMTSRMRSDFFVDTAGVERLRERGENARLRLASTQQQPVSARWTGTHNAETRDPDWFRVAFTALEDAGPRMFRCSIVQRGSETPRLANSGAYKAIRAACDRHNALVERAVADGVDAGGIGALAARNRMARARAEVEALVAAFNAEAAQTAT